VRPDRGADTVVAADGERREADHARKRGEVMMLHPGREQNPTFSYSGGA
jgi:hypothetical protein